MSIRPLRDFHAALRAEIRFVLLDIDDTLTTEGLLAGAAYAPVEELSRHGLRVIPVTGRPAGWCDMIARFWPVDGVIGENGAFYFRHDPVARKMVRRVIATAAERAANRRKLDALGERILSEVPGAAISADQLYRE